MSDRRHVISIFGQSSVERIASVCELLEVCACLCAQKVLNWIVKENFDLQLECSIRRSSNCAIYFDSLAIYNHLCSDFYFDFKREREALKHWRLMPVIHQLVNNMS